MTGDVIFARLRIVLTRERVICRLITAWLFVALTSILRDGEYAFFFDLSYAQNTSLIKLALSTLGLFLLLTAAAFFLPRFHTDSWALFATATACVTAWLLLYYAWLGGIYFAFAVAIGYCMVVLYCFRANEELLDKWKPGKRTVLFFTVGAGLLTCGVIAGIGCLRYRLFYSPNFDFGIFCNMFYNMAETGLPLSTCERDVLLSHFAVHISPVYYLILPLYYVFRSPLTLQIAQAAALALGVIPTVLLARHFKLSGKMTMVVVALYAFYPTLSRGTFFDLHENCFLPLFLLLTFLFYEKRKWIPMYVSAVLVLSVKEDAAIYLFFFALFILLSEREWLHGSILAAMAVAYFLLCGYLMTKYGEGMMTARFGNLIYERDGSLLGAIKTALVNPGFLFTQLFSTETGGWEKVSYVLQMLTPLCFLPFCTRKPSRWLLVAPILINLLSLWPYQYDLGFQYHFGIAAFFIYAMIKNLPELTLPTAKTLLRIAAAVTCCIYLATVGAYLFTYASAYQKDREAYVQMDAFLEENVPKDASVAASTFLVPHLAERDEIYELFYHDQKTDVEYVVLDLRFENEYEEDMIFYLSNGYEQVAELKNYVLVLQRQE